MADLLGTKAAAETYSYVYDTESNNTSRWQHRASFDDDDDDDEAEQSYRDADRRSLLWTALATVFGMRPRRRDGKSAEYGNLASAPQEAAARKHRRGSYKELRKCRRGYIAGCVRRAVLLSPCLLLMGFGALHLLHVFYGRSAWFWDLDNYNDFMPDWGKAGKVGEGLAQYPTDATRDVIPIACHSHNDYWRRVPVFDAIHWGCTGIEADVWLFDEELYVGHNTAALTKNRTFRNLYVDPLVELLDKMNAPSDFSNSSGRGVFDVNPGQSLILLVDLKTAGHETFPHVYEQLSALRNKDYLTYWDGSQMHQRAITVVGTGNTPFGMILTNSSRRDIFFDAPLDEMWEPEHEEITPEEAPADALRASAPATVPSPFNSTNSYYASVSFTHAVGFVWRGRLSHRQVDIVRGQIRGAHRRGLKVRYWSTPSWPIELRNHVWHVLMKEGADMLNVDDLKGAAVENWKMRVHGFW